MVGSRTRRFTQCDHNGKRDKDIDTPPPQVHLSLQGPEVRIKLEESRPGPGVVLSTTNRPVIVWTPVSLSKVV